jgi:hypothetical protein
VWIVLLATLACAAVVLWHWGKRIESAMVHAIERVAGKKQASRSPAEDK